VRVSHAARRYGSNVPGPLEARRRASKRRMGCAVAATSMGPPGGDFGALFGSGSGSGGGNAVESGWSWLAPGTQPAPIKTTSNGWNWGAKPAELPAERDQLLEVPRTGEELVEESRQAFEELLHAAKDVEVFEVSDVAALTEFLGSSADEPEAKSVSRLIQWLSGRSVSDPAWQTITALICDKIKLASIDDEELLEVIRALPGVLAWEQDESARQRLHGIYAAFAEHLEERASSRDLVFQLMFEEVHKTTRDAQACSRLVAMLTKTTGNNTTQVVSNNIALTLLSIHNCGAEDLARTQLLSQLQEALCQITSAAIAEVLTLATRGIFENGRNTKREKGRQALTWLECVDPALGREADDWAGKRISGSISQEFFFYPKRDPFPVDLMPIVYAEIARHIPLSEIIERFAPRRVDPSDIARFLLRVWLPNNTPHPGFNTETGIATDGTDGIKPIQYGTRRPFRADLPVVEFFFEKMNHRSENRHVWPCLVRAFRKKRLCYRHVVGLVLEICKVRHDPDEIYAIFLRMLKDPNLAIPTNIYVSIIKHFMAKGENLLAYKVFCDSPSIAITDVPELPVVLLEDQSLRFDIFEMLNRLPDKVPMEWRERLKLAVTPGEIEVVHMLAHSCANMESLRPSQAYRNVWALYRWLQDRGAPIQPLISRAMVTAGILRHLKELIWIPDERLQYILSIVEKVEGVKVREKAEQLATYMRATVHDKVIAKRRAKEESAWMNKATDLAGESKFRLKKWTKLKPVPTEDGRSFVVPEVESPGVVIEADDPFSASAEFVKPPDRGGGMVHDAFWDTATAETDALSLEDTSKSRRLPAAMAAEPVSWRPIGAASGGEEGEANGLDALSSEEPSEDGGLAHTPKKRMKRRKAAERASAPTGNTVGYDDDPFSTPASADRGPASAKAVDPVSWRPQEDKLDTILSSPLPESPTTGEASDSTQPSYHKGIRFLPSLTGKASGLEEEEDTQTTGQTPTGEGEGEDSAQMYFERAEEGGDELD
jgi:hypothetical protein